jgi:hypothetical protein
VLTCFIPPLQCKIVSLYLGIQNSRRAGVL